MFPHVPYFGQQKDAQKCATPKPHPKPINHDGDYIFCSSPALFLVLLIFKHKGSLTHLPFDRKLTELSSFRFNKTIKTWMQPVPIKLNLNLNG